MKPKYACPVCGEVYPSKGKLECNNCKGMLMKVFNTRTIWEIVNGEVTFHLLKIENDEVLK